MLVHPEITVDVYHQRVIFNHHGVDFQHQQAHGIACAFSGFGEQLADLVSGVHLHGLGQLAAEEGREQKVQFFRLRKLFDAGIAEADGLALCIGDHGDIRFRIQADADALAAY